MALLGSAMVAQADRKCVLCHATTRATTPTTTIIANVYCTNDDVSDYIMDYTKGDIKTTGEFVGVTFLSKPTPRSAKCIIVSK